MKFPWCQQPPLPSLNKVWICFLLWHYSFFYSYHTPTPFSPLSLLSQTFIKQIVTYSLSLLRYFNKTVSYEPSLTLSISLSRTRKVWPEKHLPNVNKSCPKMISLEKWTILTPLQKFPKNVGDLDKLIVAKGFKNCPKSNKLPNLVTLQSQLLHW